MEQFTFNDFEDYWALLPVKDSEVYFEISNYLKNPGGETAVSRVLKKSTITYLEHSLFNYPYPVCQILRCFPSSIYGQIVYETLYRFARDPNVISIKKWKLLSVLTNVHLSDKWMEKYEINALPLIYKAASEQSHLDEIVLALLSNPSPRMLRSYMDYEVQRRCLGQNMFSERTMFLMAMHRKTHFLEPVLSNVAREGIPRSAQDCLHLLQVIQTVNDGLSRCKDTFQAVFVQFKNQIECENLKENHRIFYHELQRIFLLYEFLQTHSSSISRASSPISAFTAKYSVIDFLFNHVDAGFFLGKLDFENVRDLLLANEQMNQLVNQKLKAPNTNVPEIDLYQQYYVVKILAEGMLLNQSIRNYVEEVSSICAEAKAIIDRIVNPVAYIEVLEVVYTILFYRWEHTTGTTGIRSEGSSSLTTMQESDTSDDYTDDSVFLAPRKVQQVHVNSEKSGFICTAMMLELVLDMLSSSAAERGKSTEFSDSLDSALSARFAVISHEISDAFWRLSLFQLDKSVKDSIQLSIELKAHLTSSFGDMFRRSTSSDEEDDDHLQRPGSAGTTRRRPRRKVPFRKTDDKNSSFFHSTENEKKMYESIISNKNGTAVDKRNIISKMLGGPVSLVAVCMARGNMAEAKNIIDINNLHDTELAAEWTFLNNFNQAKAQLNANFRKYAVENASKTIPDDSKSVEYIKQIAAHGFEASQISNLVESFISKNKVKQAQDVQKLLDKFSNHYPFLDLYKGDALQGTTVTDYVLSLASNYDICLNIFSMLPKLWGKKSSIDKLDKQMGYFGCLKHILACVNLFNKQTKQNHGIQHLITNTCYTFNPSELETKLKQEEIFVQFEHMGMDAYQTVDVLKTNLKCFDVFCRKDGNLLNHIYCYIMNMNSLLNFKHMTLATPEQILATDLFSLIGDILFNNASTISPNDIESVVSNLNTNILHVLTKNTCPDIEISRRFLAVPERLLDRLIENVTTENFYDESIETIQDKKLFKLERGDILSYVLTRNTLVAYLMAHIHGLRSVMNEEQDTSYDFNASFLKNLLQLRETRTKTVIYDNNSTVAALNLDCFDVIGLERLIKEKKYEVALKLIQQTKEIDYYRYHENLSKLKNFLIEKILMDNTIPNFVPRYTLIEHISDIKLRTEILLANINRIKSHQLAMRLIRSILLHINVRAVEPKQRKNLEEKLSIIHVYSEVANVLSSTYENYHWIAIMERSKQAPETILHILIDRSEYDLCRRWAQIHPLQTYQVANPKFIDCLTRALINAKTTNTDLFALIESFPAELVRSLDTTALMRLKNRQLLDYLVNYLILQSGSSIMVYQRYQISLKIFKVLPPAEADSLWALIGKPLLIIEQYIMNSRFDTLAAIIKVVQPLIKGQPACTQCLERRNLHMVKNNSDPSFNTRLYVDNSSDFSLLNNDITHENHCLSTACIDALLRMYAAKSLDFRISESHSTLDVMSQSTDIASLDSLCGTFLMPREVPDRCSWIRDEEASYCMCCKRACFTMLTRRHHCRRCGRVVCHVCSTKRLQIPNMYADVPVRVCVDCFRQTEMINNTEEATVSKESPIIMTSFPEIVTRTADEDGWLFRFSGLPKHDNLLRDEFCFEYAPSVALCLSILALHSTSPECSEFLLHYCRKFEALLQPIHPGCMNSEVDYALVTRILHCLSLAAKVRGGSPECVRIREYADIIKSVVSSGCETLLPMEPSNSVSLRKLRDSLVVAEKWDLAVEISLKCGFPKTGVMAAWGLSCLKSGCFDTAREKLVHCLTQVASDKDLTPISDLFNSTENLKVKKPTLRIVNPMRLSKNQPLLQEIITLLQSTSHPLHSDLIQRATMIKHSNRAIASNKPRKKENIPTHEPAINILHTLTNLQQIAQGKYTASEMQTSMTSSTNRNITVEPLDMNKLRKNQRFYAECVYYLVNYGRHMDILNFLVRHKETLKVLNYVIIMQVTPEQFIQFVIVPYLKRGKLDTILNTMIEIDDTLVIWKNYIIQICHMLEKRNYYNSLYQVQLLLKDTVRASMTCVKFYTMKCSTYQDLRNNAFHLLNAEKHLRSELEMCKWEEIQVASKKYEDIIPLAMKMDLKSLNQHINTICRQIEAAKFLAKSEDDGKETIKLLPKISMLQCQRIPTLFGNAQDKILLASLIMICGSNIEEGYGLSYRIIQDLSLPANKIYSITTKYLSVNKRLSDVEKLVDCIKSNGSKSDTSVCDNILELAIQTALEVLGSHGVHQMKSNIDNLIRLIGDVATQIECHIIAGQLKAAYLLAVSNRRPQDIKRIARLAEKTNQPHIKKLCEKKLGNMDNDEGCGDQ